MSSFKHIKKCVVWLLVCVSLFLTVQPAYSLSFSPLTSTITPSAPVIVPEDLIAKSAGHTVSLVYRYASNTSTVIGCLENNTPVTVLGSSKGYYKIDCYDLVGYIATEQLAQDETGKYYVNCQAGSSQTKQLTSQNIAQSLDIRSKVYKEAHKHKGVPYVYGGTTPKGFDCSGFTQYVFRKAGLELHRSAVAQLQDGVIIPKDKLQSGDLVFFKNTNSYGRYASHVGIYIGNGQIIHAGSKGISIARLDSSYFTSHYLCARRIILSDLLPTISLPMVSAVQGAVTDSHWNNADQANGQTNP